jgi:hypothetical protein
LNENGDRAATQRIEAPVAPPIAPIERDLTSAERDIREGRFQRWLALLAGASSALSGLEVAYEHYRGGYSRRVMYTPLGLSAALLSSGAAAFVNRRAARTLLPVVSVLTLADCGIGFYFHVRGIARKPGNGAPVS